MKFQSVGLPTGKQVTLPTDIKLQFPADPALTARQRCVTAFLPWHKKYLELIPIEYREFFVHVLPHLGNRTTDVHTALSVDQIQYLLDAKTKPAIKDVIYITVILHDIGWSKVSLQGIADSLSYSGLALSDTSRLPKEQHMLIGVALAYDILDSYSFDGQTVPEAIKRQITRIIRRHDYDAPWDKGKFDELSLETKIVCDADRLWPYTHQNFWQDTVRKNVRPADYLLTVMGAIDSYFATPQGKARAYQLANDRQAEVSQFAKLKP